MNIYLYKTADEQNRLNKTLSDEIALTGALREECDILSPEIKIESAANLSAYNYCYIPDFGRYYFAEFKIIRTGLWTMSCSVDVLMSYKDGIKSLPAIAGRNTSRNNYYLPDNMQEVYANARVQTKLFPAGFSGATYILTTSGGN